MAQITYPDKVTGDTFTAAEATEIKNVVNTNEIKRAVQTLSAADIIAGTVKEIIAAPGSGKFIHIFSYCLYYVYNSVQFDSGATVIRSGVNIILSIPITGISNYINNNVGLSMYDNFENKAINIVTENPPTIGNGYVKCIIYYRIEDI